MNNVLELFEKDLVQVERWMEEALGSHVTLIPEVSRHLIGSGGKRFRPLMLLATASLFGYEGEKRYPLSAVIEFIHTATLLHDDVIDHAHMRRGKISANNIWGNAASVLVGDYLYSKAFKLMAEHGTLRIVHELAATTNVMSEGEVFQLVKCGDVNLTEAEYLKIIEEKTSVLISSACAVGAILGGAKPARIWALKRFGMTVGSAFQIIDDTLDYMAKEKDFGKAIGKDLDEGKLTLPLIRTLSLCGADERNSIIEIIQRPERNGDDVACILNIISRYNGIHYAMDKAAAFISEGKAILSVFPDSSARQALSAIADFVVERHS